MTTRWGIIGCGDVTEVKSGPAFQRATDSELVAVMRRTGSLAQDYARRHGVPRWSDDAEDLLQADDLDAIYIATHPNTHVEYARRAAAAGKAVYVEKPMARTGAECQEMRDACSTAGVPLWVGYYRRLLPRFLTIKVLIENGTIGDVRAVNSLLLQPSNPNAWQQRPELSGGGQFFDAACHTFDLLDWLLGPIEDVQAYAARHGGATEDTVSVSTRFASDVLGSGTWCYAAGESRDRTMISGAKGSVAFSVSAPEPIRLTLGSSGDTITVEDPPHVHQPLVQSIVDELHGRGRCPSTGESAQRTARLMDVILADVRPVA